MEKSLLKSLLPPSILLLFYPVEVLCTSVSLALGTVTSVKATEVLQID